MSNYHFKIANDKIEKSVYILAKNYNQAVDKLFASHNFFNYIFIGIINF